MPSGPMVAKGSADGFVLELDAAGELNKPLRGGEPVSSGGAS